MQTYSGFYASWFLQLCASSVYFSMFVLFTLYQIGFCTYMDACAKDFQEILGSFNQSTEEKRTNDRIATKQALADAIQIHGDMLKYKFNLLRNSN